jgi:hypothetical protein
VKFSASQNLLGKVVGPELLRFRRRIRGDDRDRGGGSDRRRAATLIEDRLLTWRPETTVNE